MLELEQLEKENALLRDMLKKENGVYSNGMPRLKYIYWQPKKQCYDAKIHINGLQIHFGVAKTYEEAIELRERMLAKKRREQL